MKKQNKATSKLTFSKATVLNLTTRTGVKAGACSKNWSYAPSHDANGCRVAAQ